MSAVNSKFASSLLFWLDVVLAFLLITLLNCIGLVTLVTVYVCMSNLISVCSV